MDVLQAISTRRSYRSLAPVEITDQIVKELSEAAQLAPSCFNNQPWRFVFVRGQEQLSALKTVLPDGNAWARDASMIIAVFSRPSDDCIIKDRIYHQFDTGMATGFMMLRAAELGLVTHAIAGYDPVQVGKLLEIPESFQVICLLVVGQHQEGPNSRLSDKQMAGEALRPPRWTVDQFVSHDRYVPPMLTVEVTVNVPVAKAWQYWTSPEAITQWNQASADWHCPQATNDVRVGGKFSFTMAARDGSAQFDLPGLYTLVNVQETLGYTMPDGRTVKVTFHDVGGSATCIREQFVVEGTNTLQKQRDGWQAILTSFKTFAESQA